MNESFVFVTGMFRSGTTLVARLLHAHRCVAFASDPYSWLFKAFRNQIERELLGRVDEDSPLNDYYFDDDQQRVMRQIQSTCFADTPVSCDRGLLLRRIADKSRPFSPAIEPLLSRLNGETYGGLLASGLSVIREAYGDSETTVAGFKEVWTNEFAPVVLNSCPEAKVVCIVRDPRAVAASNNVTDAKYPWTFLARQWRKLAAMAWLSREQDRFCLVRFEDLVTEPRREVERLCAFLGIAFDERLIDPTCYVDGAGMPWQQNTNYEQSVAKPKRAFDAGAVDRWRETLSPTVQAYIETVCWPEMQAFGYKPDVASSGLLFAAPPLKVEQLSEWIRPYSRVDDATREIDAGLERHRWETLSSEADVSVEDQQRLCLNVALFDAARQWLRSSEMMR